MSEVKVESSGKITIIRVSGNLELENQAFAEFIKDTRKKGWLIVNLEKCSACHPVYFQILSEIQTKKKGILVVIGNNLELLQFAKNMGFKFPRVFTSEVEALATIPTSHKKPTGKKEGGIIKLNPATLERESDRLITEITHPS